MLGRLTKVTASRARGPSGPLGHQTVHLLLLWRLLFLLLWFSLRGRGAGCILAGPLAVLLHHKVVPVPATTSVGESLALPSCRIEGVPRKVSPTGSWLHLLVTRLLSIRSGEETLSPFATLLLLVPDDPLLAFGGIGWVSSEQPRPDPHTPSAGCGTGAPVTPDGRGTHWIRGHDVSDGALGLHALLLLHDHNVGTLLPAHVVQEGPGAHSDSDSTGGGAFRPRGPVGGLADSNTLSAIVHSGR